MSPQSEFLLREFFTMSFAGATQHVKIYAEGTTEAERREVRDHLRDLLFRLAGSYVAETTEIEHEANITAVSRSISRRHSGLLYEGAFPIGSTQKALNLYLKYLWCAGINPPPPQCPVDAVVMRAAKVRSLQAWTKMRDLDQYRAVIAELKLAANGLSLAEWELHVYNQSDA